MGRELQKKKNRSSVPKVRQKPKSKKLNNPRANPIIAANWDKSLSIAQNYRQLGLTSRLNHRTGGVEKHKKLHDGSEDGNDALAIGGKKASKIELDEVSVIKDPETGKIIQVLDGRTDARRKLNPLGDPLNELEDEYDDMTTAGGKASRTEVVRDLEHLAARGEEKRPRKQSRREQGWVEKLVRKYGNDYRSMSRDAKLNPMQQSQGDIKRRVQQWKQSQPTQNTDTSTQDYPPVDPKAMPGVWDGEFDQTEPLCNCSKRWEDW